MTDLISREKSSIFQTYGRLPIVASHASGCRVWDTDGNEYLDFLGGIAVNVLGHGYPALVEAIKEQADKYLHISNFFYQEPQVSLAEKLRAKSGLDKVFFSNSGSEATEGAIKLARKWGSENGKSEIIAFSGGFHGRTLGALSMMDKPLYKEGMGPFLDGFSVITYNDPAELERHVGSDTAALCIEFLQGEGGLRLASEEFVNKISELKEKYGFLLIADEIQSGMGRTGLFFAYEHFGMRPEIVTLAKGIGGGLPLGAILADENVASVWQKGHHGTTFGGNALSCVCGNIVMDELDNGLQKKITDNGVYLEERLKSLVNDFPGIAEEYRGLGLMCGLKMSVDAGLVVSRLLEKKVIANGTSVNVLRLVPPYIITREDVDVFINKLTQVFKEL